MINLKIQLDPNNTIQMEALAAFASTLAGSKQQAAAAAESVVKAPVVSEVATEPVKKTVSKKATKEEIKTEALKEEVKTEALKEEVKTEANELTLEAVRALTRDKATNHRDAIKDKLAKDFNAENVLKLDPSKYQAYVDYLNSLS